MLLPADRDTCRLCDLPCVRMPAEQLISGKEDAANNFARGHYTIGKVRTVFSRNLC